MVALAEFCAVFSLILSDVVLFTEMTGKRQPRVNALDQCFKGRAALSRREPGNYQRKQHLVGIVAAHEHTHAAGIAYNDSADFEQFESNRSDIGACQLGAV